jgi:hypothetical protein
MEMGGLHCIWGILVPFYGIVIRISRLSLTVMGHLWRAISQVPENLPFLIDPSRF